MGVFERFASPKTVLPPTCDGHRRMIVSQRSARLTGCECCQLVGRNVLVVGLGPIGQLFCGGAQPGGEADHRNRSDTLTHKPEQRMGSNSDDHADQDSTIAAVGDLRAENGHWWWKLRHENR